MSGCYISCFYIKPQRSTLPHLLMLVATFLVSTSNRNITVAFLILSLLLHFLFLHQTATVLRGISCPVSLLHFLFLHQTATTNAYKLINGMLLHFLFLHQTATTNAYKLINGMLLHFLFLHQTATCLKFFFTVCQLLHFLFLHQTATTENVKRTYRQLLHFLFLHQTATFDNSKICAEGCYISCFYIKPQLDGTFADYLSVATFLVSTSNRNNPLCLICLKVLLHFLFLHQTATFFKFCFL